ncbi:hypothetical protein SEHO0A_03606 [Salmonella enterica subsp. houtenae str. ATCC BAA-1581]|nr:hypothetical protein SEHO0A_03606 [Salmonella enterica subsp. houtenae str. ATCC BAA-1581]ENZ85085.1 hypothetical protein D088_960093 [Salmonella enterica subsp. houtenae serovar 16:z4,z32:-- str. RKS3027]
MYNIMALSYFANVHWAIKCLNRLHRQLMKSDSWNNLNVSL